MLCRTQEEPGRVGTTVSTVLPRQLQEELDIMSAIVQAYPPTGARDGDGVQDVREDLAPVAASRMLVPVSGWWFISCTC